MKVKKAGIKICIFLVSFLAVSLTANQISVSAADSDGPLDLMRLIQSETFVLMDGDTGQVLLEKNMRARMYPASTTKIMTAMLALELGGMHDVITMSYDAVWSIKELDASRIELDVGERIILEDALYAISIASANDAANGVAEHIGGSMENFALMMTERAKELGAVNTNFVNAHGLPDSNHYTTAYDLALIMSAAIKTPGFSKIFTTIKHDTSSEYRPPSGHPLNRKNSLNQGPYAYSGLIAEKTGWTGDSGYTYVAAATRNGRTLVAAVMKSPSENARWEDATLLFDYGFNEFKQIVYTKEELFKEDYSVEFADGVTANMSLIPAGDFSCLILKSLSKADIEIIYNLFDGKAVFNLKSGASSAGMYTGLGETDLRVYLNGYEIPEIDITAESGFVTGTEPEIKSVNPILSALYDIYKVLSVILQIIGAIAVVITILYIRRYISVQRMKKHQRRNINGRNYR